MFEYRAKIIGADLAGFDASLLGSDFEPYHLVKCEGSERRQEYMIVDGDASCDEDAWHTIVAEISVTLPLPGEVLLSMATIDQEWAQDLTRLFQIWYGDRLQCFSDSPDQVTPAPASSAAAVDQYGQTVDFESELDALIRSNAKGTPDWWQALDQWWRKYCNRYTWGRLKERTGYSEQWLKMQLSSKKDAKTRPDQTN